MCDARACGDAVCGNAQVALEVPEPEEGRVGRARVASYTVRLVRHRVPA